MLQMYPWILADQPAPIPSIRYPLSTAHALEVAIYHVSICSSDPTRSASHEFFLRELASCWRLAYVHNENRSICIGSIED